MKTESFPLTITEKGVSSVIRKSEKIKDGIARNYFIVEYFLKGKRKQVWRADEAEARAVAKDACIRVSNGDQSSLELRNGDLMAYNRAVEILNPSKIAIDTACREYTDALQILGGKVSITEACREWLKIHAVQREKITVADASELLKVQTASDGKSHARQKTISAALDALADKFNVHVHTITPDQVSQYLTALPFVDRTKKNHRDTIGFFNRWLVLRGYLAKGTNWLENVQNYSARKTGEIQIYQPEEMALLLRSAGNMTPFFAIGAFAGLRHAEIARLDWSEIDLEDGFIEVRANNSKTGERRLVPIHANLKAWLLPYRQTSGKVVPYANTTKQILRIAKTSAVQWKHNALRHSFISYRVSETADVPRVSDEAGNSPAMIRQHYLRRVKPAAAVEWFAIMPETAQPEQPANIVPMQQKAA